MYIVNFTACWILHISYFYCCGLHACCTLLKATVLAPIKVCIFKVSIQTLWRKLIFKSSLLFVLFDLFSNTNTDIRIPIPIYEYRYLSLSVKSISLSIGFTKPLFQNYLKIFWWQANRQTDQVIFKSD